ncbi:protein MID1-COMPLEMENTING ACTIVITY 1-like isoform X1 [Telopea speciosissima]|uniref:protein MID1-COMPLEMENTING ACTIVITY 1-like isoform X1 n=1 Tax=Telopea speciosissima TaxID=54955 RepID=UPI001CC56371|nr:protein MID1-COMPLEMENTING ACTIVITY 1-like isoform X1 [Telopea speciosissima]
MENVAQAVGVDAVGLISMIVTAARNVKTHRKNCEKMARHVKMIRNLLEKLKSTDLRKFPATGEPLEQLEDALRKALDLVESCRERSYLYLLAMGWSIVYQFRQVQTEIDRYLKLVPLISLVHGYRIQPQDHLQAIEDDNRNYTLDEDDAEAQGAVLKSDLTNEDAKILEKSLSRRYPHLEFSEALQEEKNKLHVELQRSQTVNNIQECTVIQHLIEVTENVINVFPEKDGTKHRQITCTGPGNGSTPKTSTKSRDLKSECHSKSEWQTDLFDCCIEPRLCVKTCFCPCATFVSIANVASRGKISKGQACHDLMAYSFVLGCCCYTCCMRGKLRKLFYIKGGPCDDFLSHVMCCCCALIQEWHEIELRSHDGYQGKNLSPPPFQDMKP